MNENTRARLLSLQRDNKSHEAMMGEHAQRFEKLRKRHEEGTAPRAVSSHNLFQTPQSLAAQLVGLADIRPGHSVLEPSVGLGRLLEAVQGKKPGRIVACDISPDCCREILHSFSEVALIQGDFLQPGTRRRALDKLSGKRFDRVVMNPPFKMREDIKHIRAAIELLKPGGVLVGLCLSGYKRPEFLESIGAEVQVVPAGAFKGEGTQVETLLFKYTNN